MLGASLVGKTSLVRRFVESIFSEKYHQTVGVKIDRKVVSLGKHTVGLMLWDLQGEAEDQAFRPQYLRGAAGVLAVADGTNRDTLEPALRLLQTARTAVGPVPHVLLLNKTDLEDDWAFPEEEIAGLRSEGHAVLLTSAKTGEGVEEAFHQLVEEMAG
ncbi:MAG: GTP-binding protein [Gemmatimonadales bacterium]|nr:GTP-binding protein [Gemmatimonadales bacterium]